MRYAFYDLESTGVNTAVDQPLQACIIETDSNLNVLVDSSGEPLIHDFKILLRPDIIPSPEAFMIHKIDPKTLYGQTSETLMTEYDAAEKIRKIFQRTANTCVTGFNNISFDDEMIRHTNFRNLLDPYEHEWKQDNHRTDIYMLLMLTRLYAESAIKWHIKEDGVVSLKLADTCLANGINHGQSHDAKNDVLDTIALTKLIKELRPSLFSKFKQMSDKRYIKDCLTSQQILVSTSKYISKENYNTTMALPIIADSTNPNRYYTVDLTKNLQLLLTGTPDEIAKELFTKNSEKTHTPIDVGIHNITVNKLPMVTTPMQRQGEPVDAGYRKVAEKAGIDFDTVKRNEEVVRHQIMQIRQKIGAVFSQPKQEVVSDVFVSLYSGKFMSDAEKSLRQRQRLPSKTNPSMTILTSEPVVDKFRAFKENMNVHAEIILRAKWNTFFKSLMSKSSLETIDPNELITYRNYLKKALFGVNTGLGLNVDDYHKRVGEVKLEWELDADDFKRLDALDQHVERVVAFYEFVDAKCSQLIEKAKELRELRQDDYAKCFNTPFLEKTFDTEKDISLVVP